MEQNLNKKLKQRLYKYFPSKKPGASSGPTLISNTGNQKHLSSDVLVPKIRIEPINRKVPPLQRQPNLLKDKTKNMSESQYIKKKQFLKQIQINQLSNDAKAIINLRKTLAGHGLIKDQKYVTPAIVFQFFKNFSYMCQDFFYLNKGSHPYDYHVVEFKEKNPNEYMTISCKGVTQFIWKQACFLTQDEWVKEQKMYHSLQKIDFFKKYKVNKNFRIWRNMMKRHHLEQISNVLNEKLFLTINPSRKALLAIKNECINFQQGCRMFVPDMRDVYEIQNFQSQMRSFQKGIFLSNIKRHQQKVIEILDEYIKEWIEEYKKQNNIQSKDGKNYNYSRKALLRMQYIKIHHLIKLVQAIMKDSKLNMVINNVQVLLDHLRNIGDEQRQQSIICRVDWQDGKFVWEPSTIKFKNVFTDLIVHAIKILSDNTQNLQQLPLFAEYIVQQQNNNDSKKEQKHDLFSICSEDEKYQTISNQIVSELQKTFDNFLNEEKKLSTYVQIYERHSSICKLKQQIYSITTAELRRIIKEYKVEKSKMESMDDKLERGLIFLNYSKLRDRIVNAPADSLSLILTELPILMLSKAQQLSDKITEHSDALNQYPNNVQKFVKCMQSANRTSTYLQQFNSQSQQLIQLFGLMQQQKIPYLDRYKVKSKETSQGVQKLKSKVDEFYANYDQNLNKFKKDLETSASKVDQLVDELISKFQNVPINKKDSSIDQIIDFIEQNRRLAEQVHSQAVETNRLQSSLGLPISGFAKVQAFYSMFDMMSKLWLGRKRWYQTLAKVKNQHFEKVDLEELQVQYKKTIQLTVELIETLAEESQVAKIFQEQVKNFQSVIKTLRALRDPNIRQDQQWVQIPQFIYKKSHPQAQLEQYQISQLPLAQRKDTIYTVNWLTHYGIHQWHEQLSYFGIKGAKQKQLTEVLNQCKKFLTDSQVIFTQFNQSKDFYKLSDQNKPLFDKIDEKIIVLHGIMANKYSKNLHSKIDLLLKQYQYLQQLFEQMQIHQQNWSLLQPILSLTSSKILIKQLKDLSTCDAQWKRITKNLRENSQCLKISNDYVNKHQLKAVIKSNSLLESIQKSLDDFLEKKRSILPRLHFISNQEMINLMSQAHTLKEVSPFLHKLFMAVKQLQFEKDTPTGIISFDQQFIGFKQFGIRPQGEIEEMMKVIEQQIKKSLNGVFKNVIPKYDEEEISLQNLVVDYPSQVANIVEWITWTKIGENYLGPDPFGELYNWLAIQQEQIQTLVTLLKRKDLKHRHKAIRSLFVQSLYLKQSTYSLMMKGVTSVSDFNWQKIVKFYNSHSAPQIYMNQFNSKLDYGFQFQLIGSPFIITPTCERQILNLNQIICQNSLPILVGKSCTGKSETLRGVSQLLGHNLVMCTCDNDSSIKVIERLILAASSTGSWIAFQHFDALPLATISMAASMVSAVYQGLSANKDSIILNKTSINLSPTTSIFLSVTSNQQFKTQIFKEYQRIISFRPIDQQQLYRIILDSYTFESSAKLSSLLCTAIEYINTNIVDFQYQLNVRDSKQIVMFLVQLQKQKFKSEQEMLVYTLNKMITPRVYNNVQKFKQFMNSLIPASEQALQIANKQDIFLNLLEIKSAVIVYGESLTGKTTFIRQMNKKINHDKQIHYIVVNSLEIWEIVGSHDNRIQGLLSNIPTQSWIVFDGPLSSVEPIYSQMQRDYISLEKGETIVNKYWKVIFQADSLSHLPPTLIGKVGLLNMNHQLTFEQIVSHQMSKINNPHLPLWLTKNITSQFLTSFKKIIQSNKNFSLVYPTNDNSLLIGCCYNLIIVCNSFNYSIKQKDTKEAKRVVEKIVSWCIMWGIGKMVTQQSLSKFQKLFQDIIKLQNQPSTSIFNYYLSPTNFEWLSWEEMYTNNYTLISSMNSIFIPNAISNCYRFFISNFIKDHKHFMVLGEEGVGRSTIVKNCLRQIKQEFNLYSMPVIIPEHYNSKYLQELIQNDMQQQKLDRKHFLVPMAGRKFVIEIDQMNIGSKSSSSELLRSMISHRGIYDRKTFKWKQIQDVTIAGMGRVKPNQDPNSQPNTRLSNILNIFIKRDNRQNMISIFSKMVELWFNDSQLKSNIFDVIDPKVVSKTTLEIMDEVKLIQLEQNNPFKVSYKDVNILFSMMMEVKIKKQMKYQQIIKLWGYEVMRTFGDRLFQKENRQKLCQIIKKKSFIDLRCSLNENLMETQFFYTSRIISSQYEQASIEDIENQIQKKLQSNQKTRILMFREIIDHITRLSRGIDMQGGHFMMIGNEGVGKMSIAKFACYLFKMNITNSQCFKDQENYVNCLIKAAQGKHTCILINQRDLRNDKILFLVKNIICKAVQPFDLNKQQFEMITNESYTEVNSKAQQNIKQFFQKSHNYIHLIFCLPRNPWTMKFLKQQPLFMRSCSIDFIQEWPQSTFMQLTEMNLFSSFNSQQKQKLSRLNYKFYNATVQMTKNTQIIISPKQYLQNISLFNTKYAILKQQIQFSSTKINRCLKYVNQIKELIVMQQSNIICLQLQLSFKIKKKQQIQNRMAIKHKQLESINNFDSEDVQYTSIKKQFVSINQKKAKLITNFKKSIQLLNSITSKDILLLKSTGQNQSSFGVLKLSALLLKENESWEEMEKVFLNNTSLLSRLKIYQIADVNIDDLTALADHMNSISSITDNLTNTTLNILVKWFVNFMDIVNQYLNLVGEEKDLLKDDDTTQPDYISLQQQLLNLQSMIDNNSYYADLIDYDIKKSQRKIKTCQTILKTIQLQIEKWNKLLLKNQTKMNMLTNNLFFACNTFKYLTLFNSQNRQILMNKWKEILREQGVEYSENYIEILFDQYQIELVKNYTTQNFLNCIVMLKSPGVPYLLDPNRLFYSFLKQHYQNLKIINSNEQGSYKILEQSIENGSSLLLEYFEEDLNLILSKIVNKSSDQNKTIVINDNEVECSDNFKLFILNPNSAPKVSQEIYINCPVIHFDMKKNHIYQRLCLQFQNTVFPQQKYKHSQFVSDYIANKARLQKKQDLLMSMIQSLNIDAHDISQIIQEYTNIQTQKKHTEQEISKLEKEIKQLDSILCKHNGIIQKVSQLAEIVLEEYKSIFTFKKFREVFVKILANFNEETFIQELLGQVSMRIFYSTKQEHEQEVKLLFTLYKLSQNVLQFNKIWNIIKNRNNISQQDMINNFIESEILPKNIVQKLNKLKIQGDNILTQQLQLTPIQNTLVSYLLKSTINYSPSLSQFQYISRALAQIHPILIIQSSNINYMMKKLMKKYEIDQQSILSIYAGELEKNQDLIQKYNWFLVENCDNHPRILQLVDRYKMEQRRFFLVFKKQQKMPNNVYPITRIHLCLRQKNVLLDEGFINNSLVQHCTNKQSAGIILKFIDIFNKRNTTGVDCPCTKVTTECVERNIKWITELFKIYKLKVSQLKDIFMIKVLCTSQDHINYINSQLQALEQESINFQTIAQKLPEDVLAKLS